MGAGPEARGEVAAWRGDRLASEMERDGTTGVSEGA